METYTLGTHHIDLNDPGFIANPYPELEGLREKNPVFRDEAWDKTFFTRYEDVAALLKDRRLGRSILHVLSREELGWPPPDPRQADFDRFQSKVFMDWEPPDHTRIRSLVSKVFTPKRVEGLRPRLEAAALRLIETIAGGGPADFVRQVAEPLPVSMIADLLGVPEEGRAQLRPWSAAIVKMYELGFTDGERDAAGRAAHEFMDYIDQLARERRQRPQDDLISGLVQVEEAGERLSAEELQATCIFLLNAGHEASVNGASLGLWSLFRNPGQWARLVHAASAQDGAEVIRSAVEEMLRFETPLPMFERWVLEDCNYRGIHLARGGEVALLYISGNRDPRRFDRPDEMDVTRPDNLHLTFGLGTHYCLGAPLARLELQILFRALARRLPTLHLAGEAEFNKGFVIRGLRSLPVAA